MRSSSMYAKEFGGHHEVFKIDEKTGIKVLTHTSRPCEVCGQPLLHLAVRMDQATPEERVHQACRHSMGGQPKQRDLVHELARLPQNMIHPGLRVMKKVFGGAENFADEGLTFIENIFPRQTQALPASTFLGLFTAATASTVPPRGQVLGTLPPVTGVTEPTAATGGYARATVSNASWAAPIVAGTGIETISAQISFAVSTGTGFSPTSQNGFFLTQQLAQGAGSIGLAYANFNDVTAVNVNSAGYVIQLTPTYHFDV